MGPLILSFWVLLSYLENFIIYNLDIFLEGLLRRLIIWLSLVMLKLQMIVKSNFVLLLSIYFDLIISFNKKKKKNRSCTYIFIYKRLKRMHPHTLHYVSSPESLGYWDLCHDHLQHMS